MTSRILLVGCGKMGGALLKGWSQIESLTISTLDPHYEDADYDSSSDVVPPFDVIVLAVKPQSMNDVVDSIRHLVTPQTLILSIAAGKTLSYFEQFFGQDQPLIRAMPNTPALVGKGMTVLCANVAVQDSQRQTASNMMKTVGQVEWISDESLMNAVTAVSGSGPAYLFYLIEAMTEAGITAGLSSALSEKLARQTVIGSATLAEKETGTSPTTLRQNVTSPGGTTEAALTVLMDPANGLLPLMTRAIRAAKTRGEQLQ